MDDFPSITYYIYILLYYIIIILLLYYIILYIYLLLYIPRYSPYFPAEKFANSYHFPSWSPSSRTCFVSSLSGPTTSGPTCHRRPGRFCGGFRGWWRYQKRLERRWNELRWGKVSFWRQYSNWLQNFWNQPSQMVSFTGTKHFSHCEFGGLQCLCGASPGIWQVAVQMNDTHPTIAAPWRGDRGPPRGTPKWLWAEVYLPSKGQFFDRENNRQPVDLG